MNSGSDLKISREQVNMIKQRSSINISTLRIVDLRNMLLVMCLIFRLLLVRNQEPLQQIILYVPVKWISSCRLSIFFKKLFFYTIYIISNIYIHICVYKYIFLYYVIFNLRKQFHNGVQLLLKFVQNDPKSSSAYIAIQVKLFESREKIWASEKSFKKSQMLEQLHLVTRIFSKGNGNSMY